MKCIHNLGKENLIVKAVFFFFPPKKTDGVAVSCSYKLLINVQLLLKFSASATQSENNYII